MRPSWRPPSAGPLADVAERFTQWRGGAPMVAGPDSVRWLAIELDEFAHDEDAPESDDARFVEGAGAFLGTLLMAWHGGTHSSRGDGHRVLLGEYGTFDPFAAIDAALDADDPASSLANSIRAADAERLGTGEHARVIASFAALVGAHRIAAHFEYWVRLDDGVEVDLTRVAATCADQGPEALAQAAQKLVSMLPGSEHESRIGWGDAQARIVPRLVTEPFVRELAGRGGGSLSFRLLGHGVGVALQLRFETRARYVREDEVARWTSEGHDPAVAALANLAARSERARFAHLQGESSSLVVARTGDGLDSSRLLLPTLATVIGPELGVPFLAACPHRDVMIMAPDTAEGAALLANRAADQAARAPHAISASLFRVGDGVSPAQSPPGLPRR